MWIANAVYEHKLWCTRSLKLHHDIVRSRIADDDPMREEMSLQRGQETYYFGWRKRIGHFSRHMIGEPARNAAVVVPYKVEDSAPAQIRFAESMKTNQVVKGLALPAVFLQVSDFPEDSPAPLLIECYFYAFIGIPGVPVHLSNATLADQQFFGEMNQSFLLV